MSNIVRAEVSPKSHEWGYKLGSVYIRKVHFRDSGMIKQNRKQSGQSSAPGDFGDQVRTAPIR